MKKAGELEIDGRSLLHEDLLVPETVVGDYDEATHTWTLMVLHGEAGGPWRFRRAVELGWRRSDVERALLLELYRSSAPSRDRPSFKTWVSSLGAPEIKWSVPRISLTSLL